MATRIKGKCQVRLITCVGNLLEKWNLYLNKNRGCLNLSKFMVAVIGAFEDSYLDFVYKIRTAPQITAKSPPNAPETQEITTTQVS